MIKSNHLKHLLAIGALAAAMALGVAQPAHATLISLTVKLSDPASFPDLFPDLDPPGVLTDEMVPVIVTGKEIFAGNATTIGGAMVNGGTLLLAHDYVDARPTADVADANRIVLGLEAGVGSQTGYGPDAYYSFSNFVFSTPSIVTGVTATFVNFDSATTGGQVSFTGGVVKVLIGNLVIDAACDGSVLCGTIILDLTVQAVPEPGTFALIGAGLLVVATVGWRRRRD